MNKEIIKEFIVDIGAFLIFILVNHFVDNALVRILFNIAFIITIFINMIFDKQKNAFKNAPRYQKVLCIGAIVSGLIAGVICFILTL